MKDFILFPPEYGRVRLEDRDIPVKDCYHLFTKGLEEDTFFRTEEMFRKAFNCFAVAAAKNPEVQILGFSFMSNHFHATVHALLSEALKFLHDIIHLIGMVLRNEDGQGLLSHIEPGYEVIDNLEYLLTCLAYGDRNPLKAGLRCMPADYRWGSASLMFRDPANLVPHNAMRVEEISKRDQRRLFCTRTTLNQDWLYLPDYTIWPGNYVNFRTAEDLFNNNPLRYLFFLCRNSNAQVNGRMNTGGHVMLSHIELSRKASALSIEMFGSKRITDLDLSQRLALAKNIRSRWGASYKQIGSIVHIKGADLESFLK